MAKGRILVPVDGSSSSLIAEETAAKIAKKIKASVTVLHAKKTLSPDYRLPRNIEDEILGRIEQEAVKIINEARAFFMEEKIEVDSKIESSYDPAEKILEFSSDHDLIVMGAHGENEKDPYALGSITKKVMRHTKRPILIAKKVSALSNWLACVDGSKDSINALKYGVKLAKKMGSTVTLLNVQEKKMFDVAPEIVKDVGEKILSEAMKVAGKAKIRLDKRLECGVPSNVIVEVAEKDNYDLIIMGSRGLGRVKRFLLGSVSDDVSHKAKCSVLIVPRKT